MSRVDPLLVELAQADDPARHGGKAAGLARLLALGCRVPEGWVVPADLLVAGVDDRLRAALATIGEGRWAVRSSAGQEDLVGHSFAGQYESELDVATADLPDAVARVLASGAGERAAAYRGDRGLAGGETAMAVVVQRFVEPEVAGVLFTLNPSTGADTEMVVEAVAGRGDQLVSGQATPVQYRHDWFTGTDLTEVPELLAPLAAELVSEALRVQRLVGQPLDIEFCWADGTLYLLQARPITRVQYAGIADQWSTADFKDGGVSATVCTPFMWSLYEYIWEAELRDFLLESRILPASRLRQLGRMFYGRPYWNMTVVKGAMAQVPGFTEREFDAEFGVRPTYAGDGTTTRLTPVTAARIAVIAVAHLRLVGQRRKQAQQLTDELLATWTRRMAELDEPTVPDHVVVSRWRGLVWTDYRRSEGVYFRQIFLNTIQQAMSKQKLLQVTDADDYFALISGLEEVSHLAPFEQLWSLTRALRADPDDLAWWRATTDEQVLQALAEQRTDHRLDELAGWLQRWGYHSDTELDVTLPNWAEDPAAVLRQLRATLDLADEYAPEADRERLRQGRATALARLRTRVGARRFRALERQVVQTRRMLWWREEFRDISTRFYHAIRLHTLRLAQVLVRRGVLESPDDIWMLTIGELTAHLDGRIPASQLRELVARHRCYYECYRNFRSENEIGRAFDGASAPSSQGTADQLQGVGGSSGSVVGTARVVSGLAEIGRVQPGDILVTRFTDTGWTSRFAMLSGIVTEYGGQLCHAAIVSREYGIACVVSLPEATTRIPDGARIRVDGSAGTVTLLDDLLPDEGMAG